MDSASRSDSPVTPEYSRCSSVNMSYEQTFDELNNLQKEFRRMEVNRRQKVNSMQRKRCQQSHNAYKRTVRDEHINNVKQRRTSINDMKTQLKLGNANRNQRKRQSRAKLIRNNSFMHQQQSMNHVNQRRQSVLQRKQQLQLQKDQKRKQQFLQKQRKREQKITRALQRKKSFTSTSKSIYDENKQLNEFELIDDRKDCDVPFFQKQRIRSQSQTNLRTTFTAETNSNLYNCTSTAKKKKKSAFRFMKPTLSAYLLTNHTNSLFASC